MALKITKQEYTKLIKQDMAFLDKNCPQGIELDHVKLVLANSIYMHYPSDGSSQSSTASGLHLHVVSNRRELLIAYTKKLLSHSYVNKGYKPETLVDKFIGNL